MHKIRPLNRFPITSLLKFHLGILLWLNFIPFLFYNNNYKTHAILLYCTLIWLLKYFSIKQKIFSVLLQIFFFSFFSQNLFESPKFNQNDLWTVHEVHNSSPQSYYLQYTLKKQDQTKSLLKLSKSNKKTIHLKDQLKFSKLPSELFLSHWPKLLNTDWFLWIKGYDGQIKLSAKESFDTVYRSHENSTSYKSILLNYINQKWSKNYSVHSFFKAAWLADKSELERDTKRSFKLLGLSHLLAISGFHINLLALSFSLLLGILFTNPKLKLLSESIALIFYALLIPIQPSVFRSISSKNYQNHGAIFQQSLSSINFWCISFISLLLIFPRWFYHPGFWLSYLASFSLLFIFKGSTDRNKFLKFFKDSFQITLLTQLCGLLVIWLFWGQLTLSSFLSNLYAIPIVSLILILGLLSLIPYIGIYFLELAQATFDILKLILDFNLAMGIPPLYLPEISPFSYLLISIFLISFFIGLKTRSWLIPSLIALIIFMAQLDFISANSFSNSPKTRLWVFDVGQGDALLLTHNNQQLFIDAGRSDFEFMQVAKPFIKDKSNLLLTHPDQDHFGGLNYWKQNSLDHKLYASSDAFESNKKSWKNQLLSFDKSQLDTLKNKDVISFKDLKIKIHQIKKGSCRNTNSCSLILEILYKGNSIVLPGDLEFPEEVHLLKQLDLEAKTRVFKLGHHGSKKASTANFLEEYAPALALNSSGRNNRYRHPNPRVLQDLAEREIDLWDTQTHGSYFLELDQSIKICRPHRLGENLPFREDLTRFFRIASQKCRFLP